MIRIHNDKKLKDLGFKLSIAVHDELIGECPSENAEECSKRISELMILAASDNGVDVPMKCDPTIITNWYEDELTSEIFKEISSYMVDGLDWLQSKNKAIKNHEELSIEQLDNLLDKYYGDKIEKFA